MKSSIRIIVKQLHRWLGLASGLIVCLVTLTGCLYAFEEEIRYYFQHDSFYIQPESKPQVPVSEIAAIVQQQVPKAEISQIRYYGQPGRAVSVFLRDKRVISVNPYSAEIVSIRDMQTDWLLIINSLHRNLLLGEIGKKIIYWNTWCFVFLMLSGFLLWLPRKLRQVKSALVVRSNAAGSRLLYDLHNVPGFYALPILVVLALTGIAIASHQAAPKLRSVAAETEVGRYPVDSMVARVYYGQPYESVRINFPKNSKDVTGIIVRYQTSGLRKQDSFLMDQYSGAILFAERYREATFFERLVDSSYEIHSGRIAGLPGKFFVFTAGFIALTLPVSGFLLWWKGKRKKQTR